MTSVGIGWTAVATGIAGLSAILLLALFFTIGQPFGSLNDIFIGLTAILGAALAWLFFAGSGEPISLPGMVPPLVASAGALITVIGSILVVTGRTGYYLAGLYMALGFSLIGAWLLALNYYALQGDCWSSALAVAGIVAGLLMVLGLAVLPGIARRIDAQSEAAWYVKAGLALSAMGWMLLYPIWCLWLGFALLG